MMSRTREAFIAGGAYLFMARIQHVVQPKGQELTFSKCLCSLLFPLLDFQRTDREREEGRMKPLSCYMYSKEILRLLI